jgi:alpha-ketoglutarate-dependent 2,4-dichlorophenoxyacetate dioxygenase
MPLHVTPLHPLFAAEIQGLDLRQTPGLEVCAEIDRVMDRYAVVVLRDQAIDDDQQMAFGAALGPLEQERAVVDVHKVRLKHYNMADISNLDVDGSLLAVDDRRRMFNLGNRLWHSDSSFKPTPAKYSMLHGRVVPPDGADTEFADMRAGWDALPRAMQATLKPMVAWHSLIYSRALLGFTDYTDEERVRFAPVPQRLVRFHPGSGRHSIYLSSHIGRIDGVPTPEAMAMVRDLVEHATQRAFVYAHKWRANDLVIWDNRATMHRARAFEDTVHKRDMRRTTLTDCAPTLEQRAA